MVLPLEGGDLHRSQNTGNLTLEYMHIGSTHESHTIIVLALARVHMEAMTARELGLQVS